MLRWLRSTFAKVRATNPIVRAVGSRHWIGDGEAADDASDYVPLIRTLLGLAGPPLANIAHVSCVETDDGRKLVLEHAEQRWDTALDDRGWYDAKPMIACLNAAARTVRATGRYFEFRDPRWGQELGICFATTTEALDILAQRGEIDGVLEPSTDVTLEGLRFAAAPIELDSGRVVSGTLASGTRFDGIPCREIAFARPLTMALDRPPRLVGCTLASAHELAGIELPAGTEIQFDDGEPEWARLGAPIAFGDHVLPVDTDIIFEDGRVTRADLDNGETIELA